MKDLILGHLEQMVLKMSIHLWKLLYLQNSPLFGGFVNNSAVPSAVVPVTSAAPHIL